MELSPPFTSLFDAISLHEQLRGEVIAYTLLKSDETVAQECTFAEFSEQLRVVAKSLQCHVSPGERVLLAGDFGIDYLHAFLACMYVGAIAVPAYPPRRNRRDARLEAIFHDCRPTVTICDDKDYGTVTSQFSQSNAVTISGLKDQASRTVADPILLVDQKTVAYLQYTSGSTATPKGVMVSHGNLAANAHASQNAAGNKLNSVGVLWLPLFHDMGLTSALQSLFVGYRNILIPTNSFVGKPAIWLRAISKYGGTVSGGPDFAFQYCADRVPESECVDLDLCSWQAAYNGGEPVRPRTLTEFSNRFAQYGFRPETFLPCYGLAESTAYVSGGPPGRLVKRMPVSLRGIEQGLAIEQGTTIGESEEQADLVELVSCGRPDPDADVLIVDPTIHTRLCDHQVGEIWLRSPSIGQGYWEDAESTQESFLAVLENDGETVYFRTGDLGFLSAGELYVTGRCKDLIIVNGRNVYPQDIEFEFELQLSIAVSNGTAAFGIEQDGLEAVVVIAEASRQLYRDARNGQLDGLAGEIDEFRQSIWNSMSLHIWEISFIRPGTFPRTSSGKVQRSTCRDSFLQGQLELVARAAFKSDPEAVSPDQQKEEHP